MKPRRFVSEATPQHFSLTPFEDIMLKTEDGITLKGWYIHSAKPTDKAIIICHGYPMDKGNVLSFCPIFHNHYNILLFDFRGMGESGGRITTVGFNETKDLEAAVSHLRHRGIKKIGALGFSLGGAVIILANNPYISAAISDSTYDQLDTMIEAVYHNFHVLKYPFIYFTKLIAKLIFGIDTSRVSPLAVVKDFKSPLLLIHGDRDTQIDVKNSIALHGACPNSQLWIVPSAEHGEAYFLYPDEYKKKVLTFFEKHL